MKHLINMSAKVQMSNIRGIDKWLTTDPEMIHWVYAELQNNGYQPPPLYNNIIDRTSILEFITHRMSDYNGINAIRKIRKNWSKKVYANKPENQTITFTLHPQAIKNFDQLRGNESRRDALESLINRWNDIETEMRIERRNEIHEEKRRLEQNWPKKTQASVQQKIDLNKLKKLKLTVKYQEELIDALIFENSQLQVLAKANKLELLTLTDSQKQNALSSYEDLSRYHKKAIRNASLLPSEFDSG